MPNNLQIRYGVSVFFLFWFSFANAQQPTHSLSANFTNTYLREILGYFEKNYALSFSYDDAAIKDVRVSTSFRNFELPDAMRHVLKGTGLGFEIVDNQYILIKKLDAQNQPNLNLPPSQNYTLSFCGTVLDDETGEPLPGATAYIKNTPVGTVTEADGKFKLEGAFSKNDSLIISYLGYKQQASLVSPLLVKPCQKYRLQADVLNMPDVLIRDFATDMIKLADEGGFHFDKAKMPTLPGWGEPDVLRSLQLLPGISAADESGSRLNVRGGTPDQNLVMLDGIPIYHTGHFFGLYDAFNPFVVEGVDVWRGNFGAEFGGRNSSVIDIRARPSYGKKTNWGIGMNLLSLQGYVETPLKKDRVSLLIAFRQSYIEGLQRTAYKNFFNQIFQNGRVAFQEKELENDKFTTWNPVINFGDANLKLRWKGRTTQDNAISFYNTSDRLDYHFAFDDSLLFTSTDDVIAANNFGWSWQHTADWSPVFHIKYNAALSFYKNDYRFQLNDDDRQRPFTYRYATNNTMNEFDVNLHHDWQVTGQHRMSFGYQFKTQEAALVFQDTNAVTQVASLLTNDTVRTGLHTFYAEFAYQATEKFDFTVGIRENNFPERGLFYSEPRLSFNWFPFGKTAEHGGNFRLKGGFGRYWQFVFQIIDFGDLGVGEPLWALADADIPAQELWQTSFGLSVENKTTLLDIEFYQKKSFNLTSSNLRLENSLERGFNFDGESTAGGFDFLLRKRWQGFSTWLSYSLGGVEMQFPELNNGEPFPARHDIRHRVNWVNTFSVKRWEFAATWNLRSGSPYSIPTVVQVPCPDCTADSLTYALSFGQLNTARLPASVRLDFSATWKWQKRRSHGKVGIAFYNFLNRRNLLDKDYLLETPDHSLPQANYHLKELYRLAAGATPSVFVMAEW